MIQLNKYLKDGKLEHIEVPFPALKNGEILVQNYFSAVSSGTEGKTLKDAKLGYIGKAKARKTEVKKVIEAAKTFGIIKTYQMVMNKLESPTPLGYSCAGQVIQVANGVTSFKTGDRVACGGNSANHAEVVSVSANLCVKIPKNVSFKDAAFTTIGSIAMQGVRQANVNLGENCAVIGLGIIGQLTCQILEASGVNAIGIDIDKNTISLLNKLKPSTALDRSDPLIEQTILQLTNGIGVDAVIITAGTSSLDPINFAGIIARQKANIIIVGAVPTGFERKNYFKKELNIKMSCSYGPGRYDNNYEQKGIDYPVGYVRWTENRNMQSFLQLLAQDKIDLSRLISHSFLFEEAEKAYDLVLNRTSFFCGITLEYDTEKELHANVTLTDNNYNATQVNAGFIGAGSFAQNFILPTIKNEINFIGIATSSPNNSKNIANKYSFDFCAANTSEIYTNTTINTVFITTPHNLHASQVMAGLEAKKNIYVEKPLCLTEEELYAIAEQKKATNGNVMVGFNRRFSKPIEIVKNTFSNNTPLAINYRINAGILPPNHWVHDPQIGGGRIIGEVCHFIDLCCFITNDTVAKVSAFSTNDALNNKDTLTINLAFTNGNIASISYFSNGSKSLNKEYLEVFSAGTAIVIDDFKTITTTNNTTKKETLSAQDKGHANQFKKYISSIRNGDKPIISFDEIFHSSLVTFKVLESIRTQQTISI